MISVQFQALFDEVSEVFKDIMGSSSSEGMTPPYRSPAGAMERAVIWKRLNGHTYKITIERKKTK
jgi:hypothetical protein